MIREGGVWILGDDIDTDVIIPARYLNTHDPRELARHCMEDADPRFAQKVKPGDFIVAGKNFGCGSSREHAPIALKATGISGIVAVSFARIFFRNAMNIGLPIWESPETADAVAEGDTLRINMEEGLIEIMNRGQTFQASPLPEFVRELIKGGGLVNYVRTRLGKSPLDG